MRLAKFTLTIGLAGLVIPGLPLLAAEWQGFTGLSVGAVYSDNDNLTNNNEQNEITGVFTPNISLNGKGRRANLNLNAELEFNNRNDHTDSFNPRMSTNGDIELIEDFFFIEADASARQTSTDPFGAFDDTNLNGRDNQTTTYQYSVTPYITSRLKDYLSYQLRYNFDEQNNRGNAIDDSDQESAALSIQSGSYFGRFSWGLSGSYISTDFEDQTGSVSPTEDSDNELISASIILGYRLDRKWQLTGSVGEEWNDFVSYDNDTDGSTWSAGVIWTPNARTTINLSYGERFFGVTPSASISYRHKKSAFELSYSRSVIDTRSLRQSAEVFTLTDLFGQSITPFLNPAINPETPLFVNNVTTLDNATLVNEQAEFRYTLQGKRTQFNFSAYDSRQTRQDLNIEDIFTRLSVSASRTLSANLKLNASYTWDDREEGFTGDTFTTNFYSLGLNKQLGTKTNLSLTYTYSDRDSDRTNDDYGQNRLSLFLTITF